MDGWKLDGWMDGWLGWSGRVVEWMAMGTEEEEQKRDGETHKREGWRVSENGAKPAMTQREARPALLPQSFAVELCFGACFFMQRTRNTRCVWGV